MVVILSSLPAEDQKAEDQKAEDQKAEDQKAEDQKAEDQKQAGAGQSAPQGQLESVSSQRQATAGGHPSA
jgi:hypothetical protein